MGFGFVVGSGFGLWLFAWLRGLAFDFGFGCIFNLVTLVLGFGFGCGFGFGITSASALAVGFMAAVRARGTREILKQSRPIRGVSFALAIGSDHWQKNGSHYTKQTRVKKLWLWHSAF